MSDFNRKFTIDMLILVALSFTIAMVIITLLDYNVMVAVKVVSMFTVGRGYQWLTMKRASLQAGKSKRKSIDLK